MSEESTPGRHKQWDSHAMEAAMQAVSDGEKIEKAARRFHVPRKILDNRIKGHI